MPMASLSRWTMSYFAAALLSLLAAEAMMVAGAGYPAGGLLDPATLILVHLTAIGWLSLVMAGALLQFVPVLVSRPLAFAGLALPALIALIAGLALLCGGFAVLAGWASWPLATLPAAALLLGCGAGMLATMLVATIAGARPISPFTLFVLVGLACLLVTVLSGAGFATALSGLSRWARLDALLPDGPGLHAVLGLGGWLGFTAFGVSYRLFAMFMMAPEPAPALLRPVLACGAAGLALAGVGLVASLAGSSAGASLVFLALTGLAVATGFYLRDAFSLYRARRRKALEINMQASIPAFLALAGSAPLLMIAIATGREDWLVASVFLLVFGWLSGLTLAQLVKIVSFMTWLEVYAPLLGRAPAPRVGELVAMPRTGWWFVLYYGGVVLGTAALAAMQPELFQAAALLCLAGTAGIACELVRIRRLAEIDPGRQPPAHARPRLVLPRRTERKEPNASVTIATGRGR